MRFIRRDNNEMNVAAASSSRLRGGFGARIPAGSRGTKAAVLAVAIGRELGRTEIESNAKMEMDHLHFLDYVTPSRFIPGGGQGCVCQMPIKFPWMWENKLQLKKGMFLCRNWLQKRAKIWTIQNFL